MSPARLSIGERERSHRSHPTWARKSTARRTTVVDVAVLRTPTDMSQVTPRTLGRHVGNDIIFFVGSLSCGCHAVLQRSRRSSGGGNAMAEASPPNLAERPRGRPPTKQDSYLLSPSPVSVSGRVVVFFPKSFLSRKRIKKNVLGQLQEELRNVARERCQALEELEEMKWSMLSEEENKANSKARMEMLESELEKTKESERRMLESLTCQTKQLEQTKILLEEAKLEIRSLNESIGILESSAGPKASTVEKSVTPEVASGSEKIGALRTELRLALAAEEKSKKAMDDLALVLKEVTTESSWVKEKLCETQCELENARGEAERLKVMLKRTENKLRVTTEESKRLKSEAEESFAAWNAKETGFLECMKMCEDEIINMKQENAKLADLHKSARQEISKLRDILKQAINEASVVKEALEIARKENSQLQDMLTEKDNSLENMAQELECFKVSEAAALDNVKELQSLLVASSSIDLSSTSYSFDNGTFGSPRTPASGSAVRKTMAKYPSENWKHEDPLTESGRRLSLGDSDRFEGSILDLVESPRQKKDEEVVAVPEKNALTTKSLHASTNQVDRKQLHGMEHGWDSPMRQKLKKRQILRRFGDMLRRSIHN
ncbi:hypothetical protein BHE74_00008925 [Ensete ventricosum]|nr:hypothetical protein BHE74_00008925 [Ensete ventricosum]